MNSKVTSSKTTSRGGAMAKHEFTREIVRFKSDGDQIEAHLFAPKGAKGRLPAVVMGGGWCYVKEFITPMQMYAEAFASAGMAALAFDYRGFGGSGGALRQHVDPWMQIEDYRNAISYLETRDEVAADRVGVWGVSYSGGHVLILSALDERVKANVGIVPVIDGMETMRLSHGTLGLRRLKAELAGSRRKRYQTGEHVYIPMNTTDPAVVTTWPYPASVDMFAWLSKAPGGHTYENRNTAASVEMLMSYSVYPYVRRIWDTPSMMVVAEKDDHTFWELQLDAFNSIPTKKKQLSVVESKGRGHHALYRDVERITEIAQECAGWFVRWL